MLKVILMSSALLFSQVTLADELTEEKKQVIDEMLDITGALKIGEMMGQAASNQMIAMMRQQNKDIDPKVEGIIKDEMNAIMHDEFIANGFVNQMSYKIYHKHFSLQELKEIVDFYKTKTGSKMASLLPEITQQSMMEGQKHGASLGPKIQQRLQARFAAEGVGPK
ncbi:DUF2059 domain-containing protein [Paraglaciecola aquimarina]|uniref:DUF2059 domain-containing protein n=1 Tax=Paraglaciecola aquimarina TaxID=1235557 RepID=A0ABU3SWS3_9ALTE|nr:DUF2059 domain-containing protein [Paraglaciecola aquimarina]MDU0354466.1 DUF2059 domain-containing protein [Paraglaciecola aquimarina]